MFILKYPYNPVFNKKIKKSSFILSTFLIDWFQGQIRARFNKHNSGIRQNETKTDMRIIKIRSKCFCL